MKEVKVVIGKNFGDEGKGGTVHRLCKGKNAIVVRHNGGAQAGHTVEEGNFRFVFHQLGSGSLQGCHTFWGHSFLPDLLKLDEEVEDFQEALRRSSLQVPVGMPRIYADPECATTIIYDVLLNSLVETLRSTAKHGSCGMGIYEATLRTKEEAYTIRMKDFAQGSLEEILAKMKRIRGEYTAQRLQKLKEDFGEALLQPKVLEWIELIEDDNVLLNATEQMWENFHKYVELKDWKQVKEEYETIVFENAQGLMLDMENEEYYPHLTPSHTGLYNIVKLFEDSANGDAVQPYALGIAYVTRTYVTRHGVGRLDHECSKEEINPHMIDRTNVPNCWQDTLRYAKHPVGEDFWKYIKKDLQHLSGTPGFASVKPMIYINHLDETEDKVLFVDGDMDIKGFETFCLEQGVGLVINRVNT